MRYWGWALRLAKAKILAVACLIASAPTTANEINNLVDTSQSIRDTFRYGIQAVGGAASFAYQGKITPTGTVAQGYVTKAQQDAYNAALIQVQQANYSYDPNAQAYIDEQVESAMQAVSEAVDAYVQAAAVLIEVATVNEMAQDAQQAGDDRAAIELQNYMEAYDVTLTDEDVAEYNEALDIVEQSAQVAAAYTAVANDQTLIDSANEQATAYLASYDEATGIGFDVATGIVTVAFDTYAMNVELSVMDYFVTEIEVIDHGATTMFYQTSPEGGCWFIEDPTEKEQCMYGS